MLLFTGCGLLPKKVEYFQKEVKEMPSPDVSHKEKQKQAAEFVSRKSTEALTQAIQENSTTNVLLPIVETEIVATSLSGSLGKPLSKWDDSGTKLATKLDVEDAKLDRDVEKFRGRNDELAGSKIEGSGLIQISYFTNILFLGIFFVGAYIIIKVLGVLNPNVAVGSKILGGGIRGVTSLVSQGFSQVLSAGEAFKNRIDKEVEDENLKKQVLDIFRTEQQKSQSPEVQKIIKDLTN